MLRNDRKRWHIRREYSGSRSGQILQSVRWWSRIDSDGEWKAWPEGQSAFDDLQITRGKHSAAPLLPECLAHLECSLEAVHSGGDHGIFIGRVVAIHVNDETSDPLLYFAGQYGRFQDS